MPVWVDGEQVGVNHRPEYDRETDRVVSGRSAAKLFTVHASHDGALARRVEVRAGARVRVRRKVMGLIQSRWGRRDSGTKARDAGAAGVPGHPPDGTKSAPRVNVLRAVARRRRATALVA